MVKRIVLVAGEVRYHDRRGHHDYVAGCQLMAFMLNEKTGIEAEVVLGGWPQDDRVFDGAAAIVIYDGGGGKQGFLQNSERVARLQAEINRGVGLTLIHKSVSFSSDLQSLGLEWMGGVLGSVRSDQAHRVSRFDKFPEHPIAHGVTAWANRDGWLSGLSFRESMIGVQPLLRSSARRPRKQDSAESDIVSWAFQRDNGGRSFGFTGLDSHSAWERSGLRQLVINGILWTAKDDFVTKPLSVAHVDRRTIQQFLSRRGWRISRVIRKTRKAVRKRLSFPS